MSTSFPVPGVTPISAQRVPPFMTYQGDGSDGPLNVAVNAALAQLPGEYWFSGVNIGAGATVTIQPPVVQGAALVTSTGAGACLIIRSIGPVVIAGTLRFQHQTSGNIFWGGGGGGGGGGGVAAGANGYSVFMSGATSPSFANNINGGAAAGGNAQNSVNTTPLVWQRCLLSGLFFTFSQTQLIVGGGCGGNGGNTSGSSGAGGYAGGGIFIVAPSISLLPGSLIDVSGGAGNPPTANGVGAGGGGGGGFVALSALQYPVNAGVINLAGGAGASHGAFTNSGNGGNGMPGNKIILNINTPSY